MLKEDIKENGIYLQTIIYDHKIPPRSMILFKVLKIKEDSLLVEELLSFPTYWFSPMEHKVYLSKNSGVKRHISFDNLEYITDQIPENIEEIFIEEEKLYGKTIPGIYARTDKKTEDLLMKVKV